MADLEMMVSKEGEELKALYEGFEDDEYERRQDKGENVDLLDYIGDVVDTEYILDSNFTLIGARLFVALGGPTIWVDTRDNEVVGSWGTEKVTRWLPSEIAEEINDLLVEVMGNKDGCPF